MLSQAPALNPPHHACVCAVQAASYPNYFLSEADGGLDGFPFGAGRGVSRLPLMMFWNIPSHSPVALQAVPCNFMLELTLHLLRSSTRHNAPNSNTHRVVVT